MIRCAFRLGGQIQEVIIRGDELLFCDLNSGMVTTIAGLRLNKAGIIKEFPDLENNPEWKEEAVKRFNEKMKTYTTEIQKVNYVKSELVKHGYEPMYWQRAGFRPSSFK